MLETESGVATMSLVAELRTERLRVVQAAERERRQLEQDLHDGAQQRLVEIQIRLGVARTLVDRAHLENELEAIEQAVDAALDELRTLARGIHPATLRDHGPAVALRALAQRSPVAIRVIDEGIGRAPATVESAIYFCAREAIQNAIKHAGSTATVTATLARRHGTIDVTITDDGPGITPQAASAGLGIQGMRDRIGAVGGRLNILSEPGLGTCIHGTIPGAESPRSTTVPVPAHSSASPSRTDPLPQRITGSSAPWRLSASRSGMRSQSPGAVTATAPALTAGASRCAGDAPAINSAR